MAEENSSKQRSKKRTSLHNFAFISKSRRLSPAIVLVGVLAAGAYPFLIKTNPDVLGFYATYFMWIALAESWNLAGGYAGLLNLGLVAFFALGAFVSGFAMFVGLSFLPSLFLGGLAGGILAVALTPTFRLKSEYFAIATLVVPFMLKPIIEAVFPRSNFSTPINQILEPFQLYYVGLGIIAFSIFGIFFMMRSRIGMALRAIGDEETASSSVGINILSYKMIALVLSGFIAAVAGAYYGEQIAIDSTLFENLTYSLFPIFMVIIGGIATFEGPIVGSVLFSLIFYTLNTYFPGSTYDVLVFSVVIMIVAVLLPRGVIPSAFSQIRKLQKQNQTQK
jgi:branched-chain amino acid transport system permease protein